MQTCAVVFQYVKTRALDKACDNGTGLSKNQSKRCTEQAEIEDFVRSVCNTF